MTDETSRKELADEVAAYLEAQDALDNRELSGPNAEPYDKLMRSRNKAREALNAAIDRLAAAPAPAAQPLTEAPAELRGLDTSNRVRFYEHDFYVLSNFSSFRIRWRGWDFDTSEHAYHWAKFDGHPDAWNAGGSIAMQIMRARSAHEAFKIAEGCKPRRRPDWDEVKVGIMLDILREKAKQHEYVRRKLLATGDRELVEDSWRDDFWGWGPNRDGKNMLGTLWMRVRAELREHDADARNEELAARTA